MLVFLFFACFFLCVFRVRNSSFRCVHSKNRHKKAHPPCPTQCRCAAYSKNIDTKEYSSHRRYCRRPCWFQILLFSQDRTYCIIFFRFCQVFFENSSKRKQKKQAHTLKKTAHACPFIPNYTFREPIFPSIAQVEQSPRSTVSAFVAP